MHVPNGINNGSTTHIPVIDILQEDIQMAEKLVSAVVQYGFVFVTGNRIGFSSKVLDEAFQLVC